MKSSTRGFIGLGICASLLCCTPHAETVSAIKNVRLQPGFSISVYAEGLENPRALAVDKNDVVYVGSSKAGKIFALQDTNKDFFADKTTVLAEQLNSPIGVTLLDGALYVAEMFRVIKIEQVDKYLSYKKSAPYTTIKEDFPKETWHGGKIIKSGPDGRLYIPIGAPCNTCDVETQPHGKIYSMKPDGSDFKVVAKGMRNTVGFAFHPNTKELWFTDNNRDMMGDNMPSCELNRLSTEGQHFGFPYCHSGVVPDPDFGKDKQCSDYVPPVVNLGPHVAPLGLLFYTGKQFPSAYQGQVFVAEHGSWNRAQKIGYQIALVTLVGNQAVSVTPFAEFLHNDNVLGRPVDLAQLSDGSLLVSDDANGRIYRIAYKP